MFPTFDTRVKLYTYFDNRTKCSVHLDSEQNVPYNRILAEDILATQLPFSMNSRNLHVIV